MSEAANQPDSSGSPAPAARQELMIPKDRFDEVSAALRRERENTEMLQRLVASQTPKGQQEEELTAEQVGLDPQALQGISKVVEHKVGRILRQQLGNINNQIGFLAARTEQAKLVATKGSGTAKYLPEVERMQQEHMRDYGQMMPADVAFDLIQGREKDARIRELEAKLAGQPAAPAAPAPTQNTAPAPAYAPAASGTRQVPTSGGLPPVAQTRNTMLTSMEQLEKDVLEAEARLQGHFEGGNTF